GPYRIHPWPDSLTRLQRDMMAAKPMVYVFSDRVPEVLHYHMPFWFVTRVDHPRTSIISWDAEGWLTIPDRYAIEFEHDPDSLVGFVICESDFQEFIARMGKNRIKSWRKLPNSGLMLVRCKVTVPDLLKRTWTSSLAPPILDVRHHR
ncbi:hypothetical protein JXA80_07250, partial [bacterium]|nr:hypothetical protein [candidate division CSSED10-310 bacterium]